MDVLRIRMQSQESRRRVFDLFAWAEVFLVRVFAFAVVLCFGFMLCVTPSLYFICLILTYSERKMLCYPQISFKGFGNGLASR